MLVFVICFCICSRAKSGNFGNQVIRTVPLSVSYFDYWNEKKMINLANSENPDETPHKEPSHLDFHCL